MDLDDYVRVGGFAEIADLSVPTIYQYRNGKMYDFPEPDLKVGNVLFWKRATAKTWAKKPRG